VQLSRRQALSTAAALVSLSARSWLPGARGSGRFDPGVFLDAVRRGDLAEVRRGLAEDASLARARAGDGRSAYVLASVAGHEEVAAALQEAGLELDVVEAVLAEDWARFEELVAADPSLVERAHPIGGTPLYAAALVGSLGMWRLRGHGCAPDAAPAGGSGFTPARGALEAARDEWARIALCDLCSNGADVNAPQAGRSSVLHGAVLRRDADCVRLAVRKGADVRAVDEAGRTARELALAIGWEEGARVLAEPERLPRDRRGSRFALDANRAPIARPDLSDVPRALQNRVTGASHARLEVLRELVAPDPRLVFSISTDDELAIEACAHTGVRPIIRFHLDHGAPLSLPTAVSLGDLDAITFWLERDPLLVHERGAHDFPLMWYAALGGGSVEVAERLARHGVPVDQESTGSTALHLCVGRRDDLELARWLLERGADPEAVGYKWSRAGETPLALALAADNPKAAALLRGAGAKR